MFGTRISKFDNSEGTREEFNKIFPNTTLGETCGKYVEIGGIVENENIFQSSSFIRYLKFYDKDFKYIGGMEHDFGENNFVNNEDFKQADKVRFKYFAKDLNGNTIARGYSCGELAKKIGCGINVIKTRLFKVIDENSNTKNKFNVVRREI